MTHNHSSSGRGGHPDAVDLGPTTESLAKVLAELREITQQADGDDDEFQPLEPTSATSMRRKVRFAVPATRNPWPVRLAMGGGALIFAAVLALPLSGSLFPSKATKDVVDRESMAAEGGAEVNGPVAVAQASEAPVKEAPASEALSRPNKQETEAAPEAPSEPPRTPALQLAASLADAPMSTASISPPSLKSEPPIPLPVVDLPEPLAAKDLLASPAAAAVPSSSVAMSDAAAAPPSSVGSPAGTRIASLGDVAVLPARPALSNAQTAALLNRAQELVLNRDISSARLILEKAMSGGSAEAAFHLAETYDPQMLTAWSVRGIDGDPARAAALYTRASQAGISAAQQRLDGLQGTAR